MYKKAFTLTEIAIVLIIIGIVMGGILNYSNASYNKQKHENTEAELESIKTSLISYAATYGKLPYPDTDDDGEGDSVATLPTTLSTLPYIDLQQKAKDPYGLSYYYDVNDDLVDSDDSTICTRLKALAQSTASTTLPRVSDGEATPTTYPVAAVLVSSGEDKKITATQENGDSDRVYEMAQNDYHNTDNNDIVVELSAYELLGSVCDLASFGGSGSSGNNVVTDGLIAYYKFEDNADDSSGNGYDGTEVGSPTYVDGQFGRALDVPNTSNIISVSSISSVLPSGSEARTVSFWVKPDLVNSHRFFVSWGTLVSTQRFSIGEMDSYLTTTLHGGEVYTTHQLNTTNWQHIAVTYEAGSTSLNYYVDGSFVQTTNISTLNTTPNTELKLGGDQGMDGQLDEVRIYDRALSAAEITEIYNYTGN